jgi:hypothetical protein
MCINIKSPISIINIIIISIMIIIIMLIIYNSQGKSTLNKQETDEEKLLKVLAASNIAIVENESFNNNIENTLVFDNFDKINKNFNLFMSIYFPSIDMNKIYELLKDYNIDNIQQIINDKNINVLQYFFSDINLFYIASSIYVENNNINIISFGLFIILIWNLLMKNTPDNITYKTNINDWQFYYLNDYDKVNDFYIYIVPKTMTENINTLNTNTNVIEINNISIMTMPNIYKISLHQIIKETILKPYISFVRDTSIINITDNEYNDFIPLIENNSISLYKLYIYQFALSVLTAYKNGNIDNNTQLVIDMVNFMNNPLNLTQSYKTYMKFKNPNNRIIKSNNFMKLNNDIKEEMITNMVNKLKMQYNKIQ